ncbi:MAG TPA: heme o synthase [Polyangiaceae bacterium]|jgi:protoheme IX farnesyltransferase|nr:heme o synthase [Polyangiaceae bacterium]
MIPYPGPSSPARSGRFVDSVENAVASVPFASLFQLTKPGVTRMVVMTTWCGAAMAPGPITEYARLVWALAGTALVVASASALNMFLEADVDALMARTRNRPIPAGRISADTALWFGIALALAGLPLLAFCVNTVTACVGAFALLSYVLVYTPLKRITPLAVWVGAVPGAAPPLMGWTAMTGSVSFGALAVFLLMLVWQIPHFHAIAIFRAGEYRRAGLKVLPVERGLDYTKFSIVALLILQLFVSALPAFAGLGGLPYIVVASGLGAVYVAWGLVGLRKSAGAPWARSLFAASIPYLLALLGTLVVASP